MRAKDRKLVIAAIVVVLLLYSNGGLKLAGFGSAEDQARQAYRTYWGEKTDGDNKFIGTNVVYGDNEVSISASFGNPVSLQTSKTFKDTDVIVIMNGGLAGDTGGTEGVCTFPFGAKPKCTGSHTNVVCQQTVIEINNILENTYEVIQDGVLINE